ncbi:MAG: hypothetical protein NZ733_04795 [Aigarchaeota archaeon]|nr:hypothetical protein [Aigarchaeota archaeon]MCX8203901.1 hypothetical protein [Nitrososphaeria archaeon]MDW8043774.1 PUA domain-containing protein [Nitrososphaerota archaeon]
MKFHPLSKSDLKRLREELRSRGFAVEGRTGAVLEEGGVKVVLVDGNAFFEEAGRLLPVADDRINGSLLAAMPSVFVDVGAVKHVINGASVMRPGIVRVEGEFSKGDYVVVREERAGQAIAIGEALLSSSELATVTKGKVVRNVQHHGDEVHERAKEALSLLPRGR